MRYFYIFLLNTFFSVSTFAQLAGNYTINSAQITGGTNFQTFSDFAAEINIAGISGNVNVEVVQGSGPYIEQVVINNITGSGPNAVVTIIGNGEVLRATTNTNDRHALRLSNVQYFNINDLHINRDTASTSGFYGIHIFNSGHHINITGCSVNMNGTNSTLVGAYIASGSEISILEPGTFSNITISNNYATGGGYGASVFGQGANLATNILIEENTFLDFHSNGVYLRETNGAVIRANYFERTPAAGVTSCNAIQIAQNANINATIHENEIRISQTANGSITTRGIYLFNGTGHKVYNNLIHQVHLTSGNFTGIETRTGSTFPEISFNTIVLDNPTSTSGNLSGFKEELSNTGSILRNNLIFITQPSTGNAAGYVLGANSVPSTSIGSDFNLLYVPNGHTAMRGSLTPVFYTTFTDWQTASFQDQNSLSVDPQFIAPNNPTPSNPAADNKGIPLPGITTDIYGAPRNAFTPDIGAIEFGPVSVNEINQGNLITVFPNPFTDIIKIENAGENISVKIFDVSGKLITEKKSQEINLSFLNDGIYFLQISDDGIIFHRKLIKQ